MVGKDSAEFTQKDGMNFSHNREDEREKEEAKDRKILEGALFSRRRCTATEAYGIKEERANKLYR